MGCAEWRDRADWGAVAVFMGLLAVLVGMPLAAVMLVWRG